MEESNGIWNSCKYFALIKRLITKRKQHMEKKFKNSSRICFLTTAFSFLNLHTRWQRKSNNCCWFLAKGLVNSTLGLGAYRCCKTAFEKTWIVNALSKQNSPWFNAELKNLCEVGIWPVVVSFFLNVYTVYSLGLSRIRQIVRKKMRLDLLRACVLFQRCLLSSWTLFTQQLMDAIKVNCNIIRSKRCVKGRLNFCHHKA